MATDFFADVAASFGFATGTQSFDCIDWQQEGADLKVGDTRLTLFPSPYSLGCDVRALLIVASTIEELEQAGSGILLIRGDLAKEPLMPKNFPFYNPDEHKRIIHLLESKRPQAIITATSRHPAMAGALYPFPLIEDGDFDIPSVYLTEEDGNRLAAHTGEDVSLVIRAKRIESRSCNVIARKGNDAHRRVVLFAHIDAKNGTPGATDNATGIIVLLLLAELLSDYSGRLKIEIVALNGEDYYSNPGEQLYLSENTGRFGEITLGINLDGVGYYQGNTAFSLYDCPNVVAARIRQTFSTYPDLIEGEQWYQGDHGIFLMNQRPALAITSERVMEILTNITHTPNDRPEIVDVAELVNVAHALRDLLRTLDKTNS